MIRPLRAAWLPAAVLLGLALATPAAAQIAKTPSDEATAGLRVPPAIPPLPVAPAMTGGAEHECDRLAQPPREAMGNLPAFTEGVAHSVLRAAPARAACARALAEFPAEPRFLAFAARAADRAGDSREAVRLYRLAADMGYPLAQNNLGAMYARGEGGLPRSQREAERLWRQAAEAGFPGAQSNLGALLASGAPGISRNEREAARLFRLAAEGGDTGAMNNLAAMYMDGRGGLPRDRNEAARLWREAAAAGNAEALNNLRRAGLSR